MSNIDKARAIRQAEMTGLRQVAISAIIPTLNRCKELRRALESLREQTLLPDDYEIIVVDNGSKDATYDTVEALNRTGGKSIRYVREDQLGLHFARHAGVRAAHGQVLAFIDDDAVADPNWLKALLDGYTDEQVGCVGGKILPVWETEPPRWVQQYGPGYLGGLDLGEELLELNEPTIYGSNLSIRRSLLFEVHGFNPDSFGDLWLGDGEMGLLRKVLKSGRKIMYAPGAIVWHVIPASRMTLSYLKRRSANQGSDSSYAAYRAKRPGKGQLLVSALVQGTKGTLLQVMALGYKLTGSEQWYHREIRSCYYWRRFGYELRLIYDKQLKELVEKEDWL